MQFDKEVWESRACEALLRCNSLSNSLRKIKCISNIDGKLTPSSVTAIHARQSSDQ